MTVNVLVKKKDGVNSFNLLKEFSKKTRSSGVVQKVKNVRYAKRNLSDYKKKKEALRKIKNKKIIEREIKLGKKK
ncbi:MAG: hypothetical protein LRZ98_02085 [Candidatus Pacebacteria bacterium]|nr:hypothetical protein [Candidatus Paceibacterota bacterium]